MEKYFLCLATALLTCSFIYAQEIKELNGNKVKTPHLTETIQHIVDTGRITGLSVAIIENNQIVYNNTFGFKNLAKKEKMDTNTVIYAGSFTKPMMATLFIQLVDKGIFELDKPIFHYLKNPIDSYPKWQTLAYERDFSRITPRMILSHTSGMPIMRYIYGDSLYLIAKPGEKFYYSNEGYNFLGFVVEEYTSKKLDDWAKELIFEPLGMKNSGLVWHPEFKANHATGHDAEGNSLGVQVKPNAKGAGSLVTTTADYGRFLIALFQKQLTTSTSLDALLKPHIKITSKRGFGDLRDTVSHQFDAINFSWGLGITSFDTPFGKAFKHGCHLDGWQSYWTVYPQKKTMVILMSNSDNFEKSIYDLLEKTIGDVYAPLEWSTDIPRKDKKL